MITVAVVDDDRMLLDGLRVWLEDVPDVRLAATACTVGQLLDGAGAVRDGEARLPYDVVLLDLVLGDGSQPPEN
ncbi:hypothetical protein ACISU4_34550, partial [Streptomyces wuyuanensis]